MRSCSTAGRCTCRAGRCCAWKRTAGPRHRRGMAGGRWRQGRRDVVRRHAADPPGRHRAAAHRARSRAHRRRHRALRRERPAVLPRRDAGGTGAAPGARVAALARLGGADLRRAAARHRRHRSDPPAPRQRRRVAPGGGGAGRGGAGGARHRGAGAGQPGAGAGAGRGAAGRARRRTRWARWTKCSRPSNGARMRKPPPAARRSPPTSRWPRGSSR